MRIIANYEIAFEMALESNAQFKRLDFVAKNNQNESFIINILKISILNLYDFLKILPNLAILHNNRISATG